MADPESQEIEACCDIIAPALTECMETVLLSCRASGYQQHRAERAFIAEAIVCAACCFGGTLEEFLDIAKDMYICAAEAEAEITPKQ